MNGAEVSYNDPYIPALRSVRKYNFYLAGTPLSEKILSTADCVLMATDHDSYDYDFILRHAHLIVDTRNVFPDRKAWGHKFYPA